MRSARDGLDHLDGRVAALDLDLAAKDVEEPAGQHPPDPGDEPQLDLAQAPQQRP